jgi:hypothetical protein
VNGQAVKDAAESAGVRQPEGSAGGLSHSMRISIYQHFPAPWRRFWRIMIQNPTTDQAVGANKESTQTGDNAI